MRVEVQKEVIEVQQCKINGHELTKAHLENLAFIDSSWLYEHVVEQEKYQIIGRFPIEVLFDICLKKQQTTHTNIFPPELDSKHHTDYASMSNTFTALLLYKKKTNMLCITFCNTTLEQMPDVLRIEEKLSEAKQHLKLIQNTPDITDAAAESMLKLLSIMNDHSYFSHDYKRLLNYCHQRLQLDDYSLKSLYHYFSYAETVEEKGFIKEQEVEEAKSKPDELLLYWEYLPLKEQELLDKDPCFDKSRINDLKKIVSQQDAKLGYDLIRSISKHIEKELDGASKQLESIHQHYRQVIEQTQQAPWLFI